MSCPETWTDKALEALALDELDPAATAQLRAHAATCWHCREQYDRLARVDAYLTGSAGGLSKQRQELLQGQLFARLGIAQAQPQPQPQPQAVPDERPAKAARPTERSPGFFERFRIYLAPAGLALAAVLLVVYTQRPEDQTADGYQARAGAAADGSTFGVRAFCVAKDEAGAVTVLSEAGPGETLRCADGSFLQFTATLPKAARLDLQAEGSPGSEPLHFVTATDRDAQLAQGVDLALPFSTPVSPSWLQGPLTVRARFLAPTSDEVLGQTELRLSPPDRR